jgi:hypothetical protein
VNRNCHPERRARLAFATRAFGGSGGRGVEGSCVFKFGETKHRVQSRSFDSDRACVRPKAGLTLFGAVLAQDDNLLKNFFMNNAAEGVGSTNPYRTRNPNSAPNETTPKVSQAT